MLIIILRFHWMHICKLNCTSNPKLSPNIGGMKIWTTEYIIAMFQKCHKLSQPY